jgi:hypothetical protein
MQLQIDLSALLQTSDESEGGEKRARHDEDSDMICLRDVSGDGEA